jgi:hypothetical protein
VRGEVYRLTAPRDRLGHEQDSPRYGLGPGQRLIWADAVFTPSRTRIDQLNPERTLRLARIMRDVYGAVDFCRWLLGRLDSRVGSSYVAETCQLLDLNEAYWPWGETPGPNE